MKFLEKMQQIWHDFTESPFAQKADPVLKKTGYVLVLTSKWAYKLRSVLLAIPVAVVAGALAIRNMQQLPTEVGINILASGDYQWMVSRSVAALVPLGVTAVCIALMFCSKKVLYPWLISLFSLTLPLVIWLTNVFPS